MDSFCFQEGDIEGLKLIDPLYVSDSRGYFSKTYEAGLFARYGSRWSRSRSWSRAPPNTPSEGSIFSTGTVRINWSAFCPARYTMWR